MNCVQYCRHFLSLSKYLYPVYKVKKCFMTLHDIIMAILKGVEVAIGLALPKDVAVRIKKGD